MSTNSNRWLLFKRKLHNEQYINDIWMFETKHISIWLRLLVAPNSHVICSKKLTWIYTYIVFIAYTNDDKHQRNIPKLHSQSRIFFCLRRPYFDPVWIWCLMKTLIVSYFVEVLPLIWKVLNFIWFVNL